MIFISILILIVAIALPSINQSIRSVLYLRISSIIFIYAGALALNAFYIQSIGSGIGIYSGLFQVTSISQLLDVFILLIGSLILIAWPVNNNGKLNPEAEYSLIVLFSTFGAILLISSADLISMYLSIELQSFAVYILSTLYRDSESATSAGLKYFLLGSLSSCIILLGCGLVYSYSGLSNLESIYNLISVSENTPLAYGPLAYGSPGGRGLSLGIVLIIVGYLFKVSAAPLHNWAPDVYDDSPTIVTIWITIMPKISILIFLLEIQSQIGNSLLTFMPLAPGALSLKNLLLISSLLSLIIGSIVGLSQSRIKRLFAYSTISHIGFILLALAINTEQAIDSFLFYIIQYSITNLNTFLILLAIGYIYKNNNNVKLDVKYINELKGLFFNNPLLSLSLTICLFSMAGVPPLLGFFSKQFVLYSAMQSEYYFIGIVAILLSVISASYYLKIIKVLHTFEENKESNASSLSSLHSFVISTLSLFILLFILKPSILLNSTQLLALSLFYF